MLKLIEKFWHWLLKLLGFEVEPPKVEDIVSPLVQVHQDLTEAVVQHSDKADAHLDAAAEHEAQAQAHKEESDRAIKVRENLSKLLEVK